jgi:hypothetical protein
MKESDFVTQTALYERLLLEKDRQIQQGLQENEALKNEINVLNQEMRTQHEFLLARILELEKQQYAAKEN